MKAVLAFKRGWFQVQDVSSMLVSEIAAPEGATTALMSVPHREAKSLHLADMLHGSGHVEARDITDYKVQLMQENIERIGVINMSATCRMRPFLIRNPWSVRIFCWQMCLAPDLA